MKKSMMCAFALFVSASLACAAAKEETVKSGLQVGDRTPAYFVNDCTGPNAGKSLCYRCKFGSRPVVNIFARKMTPEVNNLIAKIDATVGKNRENRMAAFVVHLTNDADASSATLKKVAKDKSLKNTPLTNYEGLAGPAKYKISKNADLTVMMWVKGKVKVNYALKNKDLSEDKIKEIVNGTAKILN